MKQVVQNLKSGVLEVIDVPCPAVSPGHLLIRTRRSLISAGTERSVVEFGQASLASKVRQNPERVRRVLDKIKSEGLLPTLELVFAKLDEPMPLGYSNVGQVLEVGTGVEGFQVGDRVLSNGRHAEIVNKPINLCAAIPPEVDDESATFTVVGAIGLEGIRLLAPQIGERVAVFGLGLIGLLAVQMLRSAGCDVLGIDLDPERLSLARTFGATTADVASGVDPVAAGMAFSRGHGVDGVLITASAKNDRIVHQAAQMSRKRGRIVLVGMVNLDLDRADFYEKELSFQVSCSYGPGRYDPVYEEQGVDYPLPFVRWTEQRNLEAVLGLLASGRLNVEPLITAQVPQAEADRAYDLVTNDRRQIGVILTYPEDQPNLDRVVRRTAASTATSVNGQGHARVAVIGAGNHTKLRLLPELKRAGAQLVGIASASGVTAAHAARKYGFESSTTDYRTLLDDPRVDAVMITTRHDLHVPMVSSALEAGKHVFVEKPIAIDRDGLARVREVYERTEGLQLMVGFNRRFSPHAVKMRQLLSGRSGPICMNVLINAGYLPLDHWMHDPRTGGGRINGEGCHWIDLMRYLVDRPISQVQAMSVGDAPGVDVRGDKVSIALQFEDGSLGNLHYFANGYKGFIKERIEVYSDGRVLVLDDFRALRGYGWSNFNKLKLFSQDKGRKGEITSFLDCVVRGGKPPMPPDDIWNVTEATLAAVEAAEQGVRIDVGQAPAAHRAAECAATSG